MLIKVKQEYITDFFLLEYNSERKAITNYSRPILSMIKTNVALLIQDETELILGDTKRKYVKVFIENHLGWTIKNFFEEACC